MTMRLCIAGIAYSMNTHNTDRALVGLAPAGLTSAGLGLTMLTGVDLASLLAPLFVLCGVHVAPDVTPTFAFYLIMAAKIWAGIEHCPRFFRTLVCCLFVCLF